MKEANREVLDRGSLPELLVQRARQSSDRRLVLDAACGLVASGAFAALRPPLWFPLAAVAFCLGAYGLWGILDREALEALASGRSARVLTWSRTAIGIAGSVAAVLFGITFLFAAIGYWKS